MFNDHMIVEKNSDWLLINKPAGISVQDEIGVGSGLLNQMKAGLSLPDLSLCHRLDKVTSGLLLIAANPDAVRQLSMQFQARQTEKFYLAIARGKPAKKQGMVSGDMLKSRRGSWRLARTADNPAVTQFFSHALDDGYRIYLLKPHTGKTHQLRVMMKSLGCPIAGDSRYGGIDADRTYLHACSLAFNWQAQRQRFFQTTDTGKHWPTELPDGWEQPHKLLWPQIKER